MSERRHVATEDPLQAGYTLVETVVASVVMVVAVFPVVAALLYVSNDPTPRWRAEALERAQQTAEQTLDLAPGEWSDFDFEEWPWHIRRRTERDSSVVTASIHVWRVGEKRGGSEEQPLVSLPVARLVPQAVMEEGTGDVGP